MSQPGRISFPTTDWGLVSRAAVEGPPHRRAAGEILAKYLPALRAYLHRRWRVSADRIDDLLQGFVATELLEQDLFGRAQPRRGRFRDLLVTALDRHVIDQGRRESAAVRSPEQVTSLEGLPEHAEPEAQADGDSFEISWARQALDHALVRMREECSASGRERVWGVFAARVVVPAMEGAEPEPYERLLRRFDFDSPEQASNLLITAKRMFLRHLRAVVAEYAGEDEVEEEIRDLRRILAEG
jgi:DNA-directed RNA polymerase specialized sigma24 family protein